MQKDRVLVCILVENDNKEEINKVIQNLKTFTYGNVEFLAVDTLNNLEVASQYEEAGIQTVLAPVISDKLERNIELYNHIRRLFLLGESEWAMIISDKLKMNVPNIIERFLENRKFFISGIYPISQTLTNVRVPKQSWKADLFSEYTRQLEIKEIPPNRFRAVQTNMKLCIIHRYIMVKVKFRMPTRIESRQADDLIFCNDVRKLNWNIWCDPRIRGE